MKKAFVIGSGPAGCTAAIYLARANLDVTVIDGIQPGGQLTITNEIENFPGFEKCIKGQDLMNKMREQAKSFGVNFVFEQISSVDFSNQKELKLFTCAGKEILADTIIIATGASAKYLGLESEEKLKGRGVSACATCDGNFYRNLPVAVIGGGDTAAEEALYLSNLASKVFLIHRRNQLRASQIMAKRVASNPKIEILWDTVVEEFLDVEKNIVTGLKLRNLKTNNIFTINVDGAFVAIGHKPNTDPFKGHLEMDDKGFLITNNTKTKVPGVFAAGDVQDSIYRQAITAAGTGCMAAIEAIRYLDS